MCMTCSAMPMGDPDGPDGVAGLGGPGGLGAGGLGGPGGLGAGGPGDSVTGLRRRLLGRGWAVTYVEGAGARIPAYGYTVGLSRWDHPELIMFGEHPECCVAVLNRVAGRVRSGWDLDEGDDLSFLLPEYDHPLAVLRFPDSTTHLYLANVLYRPRSRHPVQALQLLFPDREPLLNRDELPLPP